MGRLTLASALESAYEYNYSLFLQYESVSSIYFYHTHYFQQSRNL